MLRQAQHAQIFVNHFKLCPIVLSLSKDSERVFQQPVAMTHSAEKREVATRHDDIALTQLRRASGILELQESLNLQPTVPCLYRESSSTSSLITDHESWPNLALQIDLDCVR